VCVFESESECKKDERKKVCVCCMSVKVLVNAKRKMRVFVRYC